jgi:hypothetical protein
MNAVVVYESFWGNTAATAKAIAEGIGPEARVLTTDEAVDTVLATAGLIVVGAPLIAFSLARNEGREQLAHDAKAPRPADVSHRTMRDWLAALPRGDARFATFETGFKRSPGSAAGKIAKAMRASGYKELAKHERFVVSGSYGPMAEGELERAKGWGAALTVAMHAG